MIEFVVSAPGKVILFGEHAVVYGKTAIAAAIDLRTTLSFKELPSSETCIHLSMPETKLEKFIPISKIEDFFFSENYQQYKIHFDHYLAQVEKFVENIGYEDNPQKLCLQAIIFLFIAIVHSQEIKKINPFKIHVETELSIGSGLGSSASFAVCLATCFLHYTSLLLKKSTDLSYDYLKQISNYAFDCEKIMHGTPSGMDNTICTHGSVLYFKKDEISITFPCHTTMKILLVDTKIQRSTKTLVQHVRNLRTKFPEVYDSIFDAMNNITKLGLKSIKSIMELAKDDKETYKDYTDLITTILQKLMDINHHLLNSLGVSHSTLDTICTEARNVGFGAKLTGAGGGGYAYILIPPNTSEDQTESLIKKLTNYGFNVTSTTIGGCGVKIH